MNIAAVGAENMGGFNTTRNSLSGGNFVFTASYRIPGTNTFVNGLFRGAGRSVNAPITFRLSLNVSIRFESH